MGGSGIGWDTLSVFWRLKIDLEPVGLPSVSVMFRFAME